MLTLGVHDGHTATAGLFEDGEIIACISEERLNRVKEWTGFPEQAIRKCLEITGKTCEEIDAVGVCSLMPQIGTNGYFNPQGYKKAFHVLAKTIAQGVLQSCRAIKPTQQVCQFLSRSRRRAILDNLVKLGILTKNIFFFEHHFLHAATAYYTNWYQNNRTLVVTLDGSGDAVCATINLGHNGRLNRLSAINHYNSICDFYTRVTQFLGMKPMSHEYKVMGMAPYASTGARSGVSEIFKNYFKISEKDPLYFLNTSGLWKWQFTSEFKKKLTGQRFDWIAGAVQDLFEDVMVQWIRNAVQTTGVGDVALSGGGFMNVKLNYLISKLPEVNSLFIFPSCGDESNPVGACILAALEMGFNPRDVKPLGMVYWGPEYSNNDIDMAIQAKVAGDGFSIGKFEEVGEMVVGKLLEGKIVGRFTGRMEWGARALGNRSILADPRNPNIIHKINKAIKMRDFWMPFAPSIVREHRERYLHLRDDFRSPFMTIASDTKPPAWDEIPAALHPFDKSTRAQILDPENHGSYYDLVSLFSQKTGVGGVLNTSFNLHGDAIVCSPEDAIDTFLNSDLDVLQLEDTLIEK